MNLLILAITVGVCTQAFGNGNRVGNGGDVLECKGQAPRLLDFSESSKTDKALTGSSHAEIIKKVYQRLASRWPSLGQQYLDRFGQMESSIEWAEAPLVDVQDSLEAFQAPEGCKLVQAAIRRVPASPVLKNFIFQKDLWAQMDGLNRAGLMSHEIIYEHFSKLGELDSRKAREFNALLFSPEMETQTKESLKKIIEKYRLPIE